MAMAQHAGAAAVQEYGCGALANLSDNNYANRRQIVQQGGSRQLIANLVSNGRALRQQNAFVRSTSGDHQM